MNSCFLTDEMLLQKIKKYGHNVKFNRMDILTPEKRENAEMYFALCELRHLRQNKIPFDMMSVQYIN